MIDFYHQHVLQRPTPQETQPLTLGFVQGARFAVSRQKIRARPLAYYVNLLQQVSMERDPAQGYYIEAMWWDIFEAAASQIRAPLCQYAPVPEGFGMTVEDMYQDTA